MSKINYFSVACPRPPAPLQVLPVPRKIIYFPQDKIFIIKLLLYLLIKQFFLQISHLFVVKLSIYLHHEKKIIFLKANAGMRFGRSVGAGKRHSFS